MSTLSFYLERAAQSRDEAAKAKLANVRKQCLRSAIAWERMADQLRISERYRANDVARKAERAAGSAS
jgi:hypothetical protein